MAGQSEAPDDLIAELAKLMAQDARSAPAKPAAPTFTVRIPGEPAAAPVRSDPVRSSEAPAIQQPSSPVPQAAQSTPEPRPAATTPPVATAPDPFRFSFDLGEPPKPIAPKPVEASAPVVVDTQQDNPPSEHDSIADLIAAELAMDQAPAPLPVAPPEPPVTAKPVITEAPVKPQQQRPVPAPNSNWTPVNVPTNLGGQDRTTQAPLRAVNLQPVARSEPDKFKVPPVFGLGTTQPSAPSEQRSREPVRSEPPITAATIEPSFAQPPVRPSQPPEAIAPIVTAAPKPADDNIGLDPIDEIESLIGRAVRVDLDGPQQSGLPPERPAPRSLATPSLPKAGAVSSRSYTTADEAVLAAAQATGAEVGWVEGPEVDAVAPRKRREKRVKPERIKPERVARSGGGGFSRAVAGPLVALTLLVAAGFGLYWVLGMGGESGPAPLLTADATPTKETPVVEAETAEPQQSVVFNEMDGVVPGAEEQLVSRDQADVNEVTQVAATTDVSEEGLANRKVRTVTVRPDGTIVSGENSVAGSTILPIARPNVPVIAGAETASPELLASAAATETAVPTAAATTTTPAEALATASPETPAAAAPQLVTAGATVPAVDAAGNTLPGVTTVIPRQRPSSFAQSASATAEPAPVNALVPAASTATLAPAGQPSTTVPGATEVEALGNDAPAYVQLASQRTEEEARTTAQALVTRYGPLFGGANMEVQRVDLGTRGIYYRVRVPASSLEQASNICVNVKAAGGDCYTM